MPLVTLIVVLVCIGVLMWAVNTYVPMSAGMKKLLNIFVIVVVVFWLLKLVGILPDLGAITV